MYMTILSFYCSQTYLLLLSFLYLTENVIRHAKYNNKAKITTWDLSNRHAILLLLSHALNTNKYDEINLKTLSNTGNYFLNSIKWYFDVKFWNRSKVKKNYSKIIQYSAAFRRHFCY